MSRKFKKSVVYALAIVFVGAVIALLSCYGVFTAYADGMFTPSTIPEMGPIAKIFYIGDTSFLSDGDPDDVGAVAVNGDAEHFGYCTLTVDSNGIETYRYSLLSSGWAAAMNAPTSANARASVVFCQDWVAQPTNALVNSINPVYHGLPVGTSFGSNDNAFGSESTFLDGRLFVHGGGGTIKLTLTVMF